MPSPFPIPDNGNTAPWVPSAERKAHALITGFEAWLQRERGLSFDGCEALWRWSTEDLEGVWSAVRQFSEIPARAPWRQVLADERLPDARWFAGAELNFVDPVFRHAHLAGPVLVFDSEAAGRGEMSWAERQGLALDEALDQRLRQAIRRALSARHVPDRIAQVEQIPETLTGKKIALPLKKLMPGHPVEAVINRDAIANPGCVDGCIAFAQARLKRPAGR